MPPCSDVDVTSFLVHPKCRECALAGLWITPVRVRTELGLSKSFPAATLHISNCRTTPAMAMFTAPAQFLCIGCRVQIFGRRSECILIHLPLTRSLYTGCTDNSSCQIPCTSCTRQATSTKSPSQLIRQSQALWRPQAKS